MVYYTSKLRYYGTLIYYEKLWYYVKKKRYYVQNYGTILRTMELRFTKEENMVDFQNLRNFDL